MKLNLKSLFIGFLLATLLFTNTVVADTITKSIEVQLNNINIALNGSVVGKAGQNYQLSDGSLVPYSILYNGTTYVPLRKLGELLDMKIGYDGATNTAMIGEGELEKTGVWKLSDSNYIDITDISQGYYSNQWVSRKEGEAVMSTTADGLEFVVKHTWTNPPSYITPNQKVSLTLGTELEKYVDTPKKYNMSSTVHAYWGTELTTHRLDFSYARNKRDMKEEYEENYDDSRFNSTISTADAEVTKHTPELSVYFTAPESGKYPKLYVVVQLYGPRAGYWQYTYDWVE